jgi:hypothetical protein
MDQNQSSSHNLINFSKYKLLFEFVTDLLQYQNVNYKFRRNDHIRMFLMEDIEAYFERAQHEYINSSSNTGSTSTLGGEDPLTPAQIVEAWLFDRSRLLEPNDVHKYPRLRSFSLKPPPTINIHPSSSNHSKRNLGSIYNESRLKESNRSQSTTRIIEQKLKGIYIEILYDVK